MAEKEDIEEGTRLETGMTMPDFTYDTPFATGERFSEQVQKGGKTVLLFLRFFGCPICQLDMKKISENYDSITADGGRILVVLQSDPAKLADQITQETFPFDIVCDPDQELYQRFAVKPASSQLGMISFKTIRKIAEATSSGIKHGDSEGNENQLPAAFLIDSNMKVLQVHYGKSGGDSPDVETLTEWLK